MIFGKLLPLLAPIAILALVMGLVWKLTRGRIRVAGYAKRWRIFSQDQAWHVATAPSGNPASREDANGNEVWVGSIRLDFTHNLVAFDVHRSEAPICVSVKSIREIGLVDRPARPSTGQLYHLLAIEVRLKGEKYPTAYYSDDVRQILQTIERMRSPSGSSYPSVA